MNPTASTKRPRRVPRVHIVGRKNAGKTTLVCELVAAFRDQGLRVATVKHTHHAHELDTPGKDSHRHREAGAAGVGILSPRMTAAFVPTERDDRLARYDEFEIMFADCDLIIVEGDLNTSAPKAEVWRPAVKEPPYAADNKSIAAVITDDAANANVSTWPRSNLTDLTRHLLQLAQAEN